MLTLSDILKLNEKRERQSSHYFPKPRLDSNDSLKNPQSIHLHLEYEEISEGGVVIRQY